nr:hypothetical protein [uncultured Sphingomonas sp.]
MTGRIILAAILGMTMSHAAVAGTTVRRETCPRADKQQPQDAQRAAPQSPQRQARGQAPDCRIQKPIPAVVDPTPFFLL